LTPKEEPGATEQKHKFKLKGVPAKLRLRLIQDQTPDETTQRTKFEEWTFETETETLRATEPVKEVAVILYVDEQVVFEGQTDADGCVEASISPGARTGRVKLYPGTEKETEIPLELGCVEPVDEPPGVAKRLHNLGYNCSAETQAESEDLQMAIKEFQTDEGLDATGTMDQQTRDALKNAHGG
ncbi:MAG: peptidoglycan-binding protein, partial [Methylotetracoccus sp.]|nr:peptidoglycan-binding protein [Methylotetracoccus sp.]